MVKLTFRPWAEFFDLNTFKIPAQQDLPDRLQVNLVYYQANYVAITVACLTLVCFWEPLFLIGLSAIIGSAIYLFSIRKSPIVIGDKVLNKREVMLSYCVLSLLLCLMFGGARAIVGLAVAALVIILHSTFRQRSLKSKVNVGLINMLSGHGDKEDGLGGSDEPNYDDEENPTPGGSRMNDDELAKLTPNNGLAAEQQQVRSAFRASMRQKYLKRN